MISSFIIFVGHFHSDEYIWLSLGSFGESLRVDLMKVRLQYAKFVASSSVAVLMRSSLNEEQS